MVVRIAICIAFYSAFYLPSVLCGQQEYFYSRNGVKIYMDVAENRFVVKSAVAITGEQVAEGLRSRFPNVKAKSITGIPNYYDITIDNTSITAQDIIKELKELHRIDFLTKSYPVFLINDKPVIVHDVFVVNLQSTDEYYELERLNKNYGVEILRRSKLVPTIVTLRVPDDSDYSVTEMARHYYESLNLEWSTPDFKREWVMHSTDPYYPYQFYMHMISASSAWDVNQGDANIIVAVVDQGVEVHEDLPSSRLTIGLDGFEITDGEPGENEAHGMAVAGIIAATHNTIGVSGLAPNVKIMPIRIFDS